ncbi:hypothetical protein [Mesorhizobium sp.]|uniref:hypothetical protein n=1 Tax=Mesorhizobium sp. TaxID=1871066 RepID=UPI00257BDB20|nr:hypothetical protein [Mesorhizobium sp.]
MSDHWNRCPTGRLLILSGTTFLTHKEARMISGAGAMRRDFDGDQIGSHEA